MNYTENQNRKVLNKVMEVNKIICGNCLDVMKTFPDGCIDMTCTSPPYDSLRSYKGYTFDFEGIARQLFRVTKKSGVVVWVVGDATVNGSETGTSFRQALYFMECGFNLHDTMIYKTEGLTLNHNRYEQEFEFMFILSKGKPSIFNPITVNCKWYKKDSDRTGQKTGTHSEINKKLRSDNDRSNIKKTKIMGNVWKYSTGYGHSAKGKIPFKHPAIFPEKLANDHIISWSNKGDLVLDPFCGSGTVPKMAIENHRDYIGIEIAEEYCNIANQRISQAQPQLF